MLLKGQCLDPVHISDVLSARNLLRTVFPASPLLTLEPLNQQLGGKVWMKAECLLPTGAYKYRGATNKINATIRENGPDIKIVTASSGNHGMACAFAAKTLGIDAKVVVPVPTPEIKKNTIRNMGATLVVEGESVDGAFQVACGLMESEDRFYIHPVNDKYTVAGQGTIALEIFEQNPDVDQVIVPIGGGGLLSGIAFAMKQLKPSVKVIGVCAEGSPTYYECWKSGEVKPYVGAHSIADAIVTGTPWPYLFDIMKQNVDDIVTVTDENIMKAVKMTTLYGKLAVEGSGAVPLAAILEGKAERTDNTVLICSGGNIDLKVLEKCLAVEI